MFNQGFSQPNQGINLNSNWKVFNEILQKALGVSPQLWASRANKETPDFLAIQESALQGPYGSILRQYNEGMILLVILEQYQNAIDTEVSETLKLIEEMEGSSEDEAEGDRDSGKEPEEKKVEIVEKYNALVVEQKKTKNIYRNLNNQLSRQLLRYVREVNSFIVNVAQKEVLSQAERLGYHLNKAEIAIIETPVMREDLERILKESYEKAQIAEISKIEEINKINEENNTDSSIPEAPTPPPVPEVARNFPKTEDFMCRSLLDLEMRTLMALNANMNRRHNESLDSATESEENHHEGAKTVIQAKQLAENRRSSRNLRHSLNLKSGLEAQPRPRAPKERRDSRMLYSAKDTLSLLKDFQGTFSNLQTKFDTLNELHQKNTDEVFTKMRDLIDAEKRNKPDNESTRESMPTLGQ